jgi:hypothetical protein
MVCFCGLGLQQQHFRVDHDQSHRSPYCSAHLKSDKKSIRFWGASDTAALHTVQNMILVRMSLWQAFAAL